MGLSAARQFEGKIGVCIPIHNLDLCGQSVTSVAPSYTITRVRCLYRFFTPPSCPLVEAPVATGDIAPDAVVQEPALNLNVRMFKSLEPVDTQMGRSRTSSATPKYRCSH